MEYPHLVEVVIKFEGKGKREVLKTIGSYNPFTYLHLLNILEYNRIVFLQRFENSLDFILMGISHDLSVLRLEVEALLLKNVPLYILRRALIFDENGREQDNTPKFLKLIKYHPEIWKLYEIGSIITGPQHVYII